MAIALYMDHHVPRAIAVALRARGVDVLAAYEDNASRMDDPALLDRAGALGRVLFTRDRDFLVEAHRRQSTGNDFVGIVYAHQEHVSIGQCIQDLELIAQACSPDDLRNRVEYLPL